MFNNTVCIRDKRIPGADFDNKLRMVVVQMSARPGGLLWPDWDNPLAFIPVDGIELQMRRE